LQGPSEEPHNGVDEAVEETLTRGLQEKLA